MFTLTDADTKFESTYLYKQHVYVYYKIIVNMIPFQDIFPDKAMGRKILSLVIKCPSEYCHWTGELRDKEVTI